MYIVRPRPSKLKVNPPLFIWRGHRPKGIFFNANDWRASHGSTQPFQLTMKDVMLQCWFKFPLKSIEILRRSSCQRAPLVPSHTGKYHAGTIGIWRCNYIAAAICFTWCMRFLWFTGITWLVRFAWPTQFSSHFFTSHSSLDSFN